MQIKNARAVTDQSALKQCSNHVQSHHNGQTSPAPAKSGTFSHYAQSSFTDRIKALASGNWAVILQPLGVDAHCLDGRNLPCPACGGKDRFQLTVSGAGASYGW